MIDTNKFDDTAEAEPSKMRSSFPKIAIAFVVVALFAGVVAAKVLAPRQPADSALRPTASMTSVHNDAVADYEAALKAGKPIYVLFHSLS